MVSKWILGGLAVAGVGAGFALAGPPRPHAPTLANAVEVEQLYHNEVALSTQESHLQQLLGFARADLSHRAAPGPHSGASTAGGVDRVARLAGAVQARHHAASLARGRGRPPGGTSGSGDDDHNDVPAADDHHDDGTTTHHDEHDPTDYDDDQAVLEGVTTVAPTTNPTSKAKKRRRAATVPGMVVTAATLGTTGLAFAYSVKTAPPTNTGKSAQAAAVAAETAREGGHRATPHIDRFDGAAAQGSADGRGIDHPTNVGAAGVDGVDRAELGHLEHRGSRRGRRVAHFVVPQRRSAGGGPRDPSRGNRGSHAERSAGGRRPVRRGVDAQSGSVADADAHDHPDDSAPSAPSAASAGDVHHRGLRLRVMTAASAVLGTARAMATDVTVHGIGAHGNVARAAARDALLRFHDVDTTCTRFDPHSPLMRVNARPDRWHEVPPTLFLAVQEAYRAHQKTKGRFDPRRAAHPRRARVRPQPRLCGRWGRDLRCGRPATTRRPVAASFPGWSAPAALHRPRAGGSRRHRQGARAPMGVRAVGNGHGRLPDRCRRRHRLPWPGARR